MPTRPVANFRLPPKDGQGGFVNNPDSSRKSLKIILPNKYTDKVKKVEVFGPGDVFYEKLYRQKPNESSNRMRYYGKLPIAKYPDRLTIFFTLKNGKVGSVKVKDPQVRQD